MSRAAEFLQKRISADEAWETMCQDAGLLDWLDNPARRFVHEQWVPTKTPEGEPLHMLVQSLAHRPQQASECAEFVEAASRVLAVESILREGRPELQRMVWRTTSEPPSPEEMERPYWQQTRRFGAWRDFGIVHPLQDTRLVLATLYTADTRWFELPDVPAGKTVAVMSSVSDTAFRPIVVVTGRNDVRIDGAYRVLVDKPMQSKRFYREETGQWTLRP